MVTFHCALIADMLIRDQRALNNMFDGSELTKEAGSKPSAQQHSLLLRLAAAINN